MAEQIESGAPIFFLSPVMKASEIVAFYKLLTAFIEEALISNVDTVVVGDRIALTKAGAEKLCRGFDISVQYEILESETNHEIEMEFASDWVESPKPDRDIQEQMKKNGTGKFRKIESDWVWFERGKGVDRYRGLYRYVVKAIAYQDGKEVGQGLGSCSSLESKYRGRALDLENTILKMARKRAFVDAVLTTLGLSDRFTQDIEEWESESKQDVKRQEPKHQEPKRQEPKHSPPETKPPAIPQKEDAALAAEKARKKEIANWFVSAGGQASKDAIDGMAVGEMNGYDFLEYARKNGAVHILDIEAMWLSMKTRECAGTAQIEE